MRNRSMGRTQHREKPCGRMEGSGMPLYGPAAPSRKVQMKKSWVRKVEGTDMYTLCGVFQ